LSCDAVPATGSLQHTGSVMETLVAKDRRSSLENGSTGRGSSTAEPELLPVRMLNHYAYCPRLFHLVYVEGRWADNVYTLEGQEAHRRVDRLDHVLPDPEADEDALDDEEAGEGDGDERPVISRSVALASERLGITAKS